MCTECLQNMALLCKIDNLLYVYYTEFKGRYVINPETHNAKFTKELFLKHW